MKTLHVPQYKNLSVEKILEFVIDKPYVFMYFPDEIDMPKVPKQWLVNVLAAVLGESFKDWVVQQVKERNTLMCEKKEVMIAMDPEMAAKFEASTHVSRKYLPPISLDEKFEVDRDRSSRILLSNKKVQRDRIIGPLTRCFASPDLSCFYIQLSSATLTHKLISCSC